MLLNVHTAYSLLQSTLKIEHYVENSRQLGYRSIGIADQNVMHGVLEFYKACLTQNIKPLIGMTMELGGTLRQDKEYPLILYATNYIGYQHLIRISKLLTSSDVEWSQVWQYCRETATDLIALTPGRPGELEQALIHEDLELAQQIVSQMQAIFGHENVYVGLPIYPYNPLEVEGLVKFAEKNNLTLIINQLVNTLEQGDAFSLKVMQAIDANETLDISMRQIQGGHYLYSAAQMRDMYSEAGFEQVVDNTERLIDRLSVEIPLNQSLLPKYKTPEGYNADDYLAHLTSTQLANFELAQHSTYQERLKHELAVISEMGFSDYFLIVWDIIDYCHRSRIRVGPGRGSAAGSLVSYLLQITLVDPIAYDLLFERFLNPERRSMPDIDIDIPDNKRDLVLQYVETKYGHEQVAQICTFGTFGAKQAIRDTLRILGFDGQVLRHWAQAIPRELNISLDRAYRISDPLRRIVESSEVNRQIFQVSLTLEGLPRHMSTHAAAVVINDFPIEERIPVIDRPGQLLITQFSMYDVEAMGLLKMDFLGLRNLKLLDDIVDNIQLQEKETIVVDDIPMDDEATLELFRKANMNGIFQFESEGIKQVLRKLKPESFEDIVAVNALYRPGPMKQIDRFIQRKHGQERFDYLHPLLEPILAKTYGIIVYQEQVMQVCQQMAGFSLGQADILRRAMGKKQADVMEQQRVNFVDGAVAKGIETATAEKVYQYIYEFANYGFNRAHAVVYSTLAYQLAYLKAHYPLAFYQALLNNGRSHSTLLSSYIQEAKRRLKTIESVDINRSLASFSIDEGRLRVGFDLVKGIRKELVRHIIEERQQSGPYTNLLNFLRRLPRNFLKSDIIQPLIEVGAFDTFGYNRATLTHNLNKLIQSVEFSGQNISLFTEIEPKIEWIKEWPLGEMLNREQENIGFHLAGHPMEEFETFFEQQSDVVPLSQIESLNAKQKMKTIGLIKTMRVIRTKKNDLMAFVTLSDVEIELETVVFPQQYQRFEALLAEQKIVYLEGMVDLNRRGEKQLIVNFVQPATEIKQKETKAPPSITTCYIKLLELERMDKQIKQLKQLALDNPGPARIILVVPQQQTWQLNAPYLISYSQRVQEEVRRIFGHKNVVFK